MPRYYFDIDDGERQFIDTEGSELSDVQAARKEAIGILPDIAREVFPDGDWRQMMTRVRDEAGQVVLKATLSLEAEWVRADRQ